MGNKSSNGMELFEQFSHLTYVSVRRWVRANTAVDIMNIADLAHMDHELCWRKNFKIAEVDGEFDLVCYKFPLTDVSRIFLEACKHKRFITEVVIGTEFGIVVMPD